KSSSSSAKSSSSVNSSSSVKSSSSSSAKSSSSVASSSSGEYVPFDHSKPLLADSIHSGAYKIYEDTRDGQRYYYLTINGKRRDGTQGSVTIFAQNLNYGKQIVGNKNQDDDNNPEKYCYDDDWTRCDEYGGLYQWAETMNLPFECNTKSCANLIQDTIDAKGFYQGICPDGWRLMTYDDYELIYRSSDKGAIGIRSQYTFKGSNYTGFSLVGAGYRHSKDASGFEGRLTVAAWYYPAEVDKNKNLSTSEEFNDSDVFPSAGYSYQSKDTQSPNTAHTDSKLWGLSVRCVKVYQE
ncbi:FISUMP domain-containing protein, partial [Fibrobacter sp. UWH1]|uniref:FISUMP domain-containing protein n=1 Tax=Fibrobacter sp. UWH1 TaxID=1964354 RepID=UPI000B5259AF